MQETKLTVRVPRDLLENIKRYAAQNNTTLTDLIEAYLRRIPVIAANGQCPHRPALERHIVTGCISPGLQEAPGREICQVSRLC